MNQISLDCKFEQQYHCVISHNDYSFEFAKAHFQDYSNLLFLSDMGVNGTINVACDYPSNVYGELPYYIWVANNLRSQDWVSIHHYRRKARLSLGLTLPTPISFNGSMAEQMAYYHSPNLSKAVMQTLEPMEQQIFVKANQLIPYNMMNAPVEFIQKDYLPYILNKITLLQGVLDKDFKPDETFFEPKEGKRVDEWYQNRVYGFAMERYTTLFFLTRNYGQSYQDVRLLEERTKNLSDCYTYYELIGKSNSHNIS